MRSSDLQDFAVNADEGVMRTAAHNMVRHLAAGMAMITCREPLLLAISTNLKTAFTGLLRVSGHLSGSEGQGKLSSLLGPLSRLILPLFALFPPPPCAPPPQPSSEEQKVMIEQASQQLSADNTELACAFIQKMAVEKAISEIDKRLCEVSVWGWEERMCVLCEQTLPLLRSLRRANRPAVRAGGTSTQP